MSEALVRLDRVAEFLRLLEDLVADFPDRHPGLVRHEILVDLADARRVQYVGVWRDEDALVDYAGPDWRTVPVTFPGEEQLLESPLALRHFRLVE